MCRSIAIVLLAGGLASLFVVSAAAESAVVSQEYGRGVHAYFAGDYVAAHERLTAAVDGGAKDPRVYYFRGLVYLKLGRGPEAAMDFRQGAALESKDLNGFYNVGKSLERVQGEARVELERYRVQARMAAYEEAERIRKARYEAIRREEERVLREQALAPPEEAAETVPTPSAEEKKPGASTKPANPFEPDENPPAAGTEKTPAGQNPFEEPEKKEQPKPKSNLLDVLGKSLGKSLGGGKKPDGAKGGKDDKKADGDKSAPDDPFAEGDAEKKPAEKKPDEKPSEKKPAEKKPDGEKNTPPEDPFA